MYRTLPYIGLFAVTVLLQVFLFDNLSVSIYLNPLVYIAFLALLPLDTKPVALLGAGLLLGVVMDYAMGAAGINTIATLLIAFLRPALVNLLFGQENAKEGGIPSANRMGQRTFIRYLLLLTLIHHTVFFLLEALSWSRLPLTVLRIAASTLLTAAFLWLIARIFNSKLPSRL